MFETAPNFQFTTHSLSRVIMYKLARHERRLTLDFFRTETSSSDSKARMVFTATFIVFSMIKGENLP
jgi:hypothetical protein